MNRARLSTSHPGHRPPQGAFTIITVLIILTLLAVVAVGFLSSMTAERTTSVAYANKAKADQAAQAGVDSAVATLRTAFKYFPDSCTVWDPLQSANDDGTNNAGTSLYYRAISRAPLDADKNRPPMLTATQTPDARNIYVLPLTSGVINGTGVLEKDKATAIPTLNPSAVQQKTAPPNFVDLNIKRTSTDTEGWIGSSPTRSEKTQPTPIRVPWVEVKDANGTVNSRYAFWVEDESFKANINYADLGNPSDLHKRRDNTKDPLSTDPLGYIGPRDLDFAGPLKVIDDKGQPTGSPDPTADQITNAKALLDTRLDFPTSLFPESLGYEHATLVDPAAPPMPTIADRLRFLTTTTSGGLNLSRHGSQRLNLNALIPQTTATSGGGDPQKQIDELVQTMRFHVPNFGQRFYRGSPLDTALNTPTVPGDNTTKDDTDHSLIYLYKVATNIKDAIDSDSLPTYVNSGGAVATGKIEAWPSTQFWAIGKDACPLLSEAGVRFTGNVSGGQYLLNVDYYIEVWNMTDKDIKASDLGPHPVVRINQPITWSGTNRNTLPDGTKGFARKDPLTNSTIGIAPWYARGSSKARDFEFAIDQYYNSDGSNPQPLVFPAGKCIVLTTDAKMNHVNSGAFNGQDCRTAEGNLQLAGDRQPVFTSAQPEPNSNVRMCKWNGPGTSSYAGPMPDAKDDIISADFLFTGSSDYDTDVIIENDNGILDGMPSTLPITGIGTNTTYLNYSGSGTQPLVFGGYLRGNWTNTTTASTDGLSPGAVGDPRANNEQLTFNITNAGVAADAGRFKNWDVIKVIPAPVPYTGIGVIPTLGLPNYLSVHPQRLENPWPDYPPLFGSTPTTAPVAADLIMSADKAVAIVPNTALSSIGQLGHVYDPTRVTTGNILYARGGGRTLKIGQHDDRWDGSQTNFSREWTSWRLLDFFCIADPVDQPRLLTGYGVEQPGLININGVARDSGAALRAALLGYKYQPAPDGDAALSPSGAFTSALAPALDQLVAEIQKRITTPLSDTKTYGVNTGKWNTGQGPFWERGELSEVWLFGRTPSTGSTPLPPPFATSELTGKDMSSQVGDRGREELFKRVVELITTRGNTFTVYVVGQALSPARPGSPTQTGPTILSTQQLKVTFKLVPKAAAQSAGASALDFHPGTDDTGKTVSFNYSTDDGLRQRFAAPDHYDIQIIASRTGY